MRANLLRFLALLIFLLAIAAGHHPAAAAGAESHKQFFFNRPHEVPPDYVYRTGRIFLPPPGEPATPRPAPDAPSPGQPLPGGEMLAATVAELARQLLGNALEEVADQYAVGITTFVNLNQLYRTSALGRYVGEQLMGELQRAGVEVIELRKTPSIMVGPAGEYALSRDMEELSFVHPVQVILVGTYTIAGEELFFNARLLRNRDGKVLSSASLVAALDDATRRMLADESMPSGPGTAVRVSGRRD